MVMPALMRSPPSSAKPLTAGEPETKTKLDVLRVQKTTFQCSIFLFPSVSQMKESNSQDDFKTKVKMYKIVKCLVFGGSRVPLWLSKRKINVIKDEYLVKTVKCVLNLELMYAVVFLQKYKCQILKKRIFCLVFDSHILISCCKTKL